MGEGRVNNLVPSAVTPKVLKGRPCPKPRLLPFAGAFSSSLPRFAHLSGMGASSGLDKSCSQIQQQGKGNAHTCISRSMM
eukprot:3875956-Amphidinium_carterae.1